MAAETEGGVIGQENAYERVQTLPPNQAAAAGGEYDIQYNSYNIPTWVGLMRDRDKQRSGKACDDAPSVWTIVTTCERLENNTN